MIQHADGVVLVVADGSGGSGGGSEAADSVLLWIRAHVTRVSDIRPAFQWRDLLAQADSQMQFSRGETTAVVTAVWEGGLSGASVGDSAAWLICANGWENLTAGQQHKPLVGSGNAKPVSFERTGFGDEERLLLVSDGIVKYATPARICEIVRAATDLQSAAEQLVDAVRLRSGKLQDDVAVVICRRRTSMATFGSARKRYTITDDEMREEEIE